MMSVGIRHVYDIEVRDHHNFIVNDVVVHNCTGTGAQKLFVKAKPHSIIDIATLTSIYRPGPLAAHVDKLYIKAQEGERFDWGDERISEILSTTKGLLIFQEQVMLLAEKCAGFPKDKCDEVRRAIMKRSISGGEEAKKAAQETRDSFVEGCINNGYDRAVANNLYDKILFFAGYGFNKSLYFCQPVNSYFSNGTLKQVKRLIDIEPGDLLLSRDEITRKEILVPVIAKHDHGMLELVEVELTTGEKIKCTWNHKFRVKETGEMLSLREIYSRNLSIVVEHVIASSFSRSRSINTSSNVKHGGHQKKRVKPGSGVRSVASRA
jgi:hypothetical protein